ncbi:MAG: hypothetical protein NTY93_01200 [Candidatus Kaiserbacteria bacterium]|nr:hypothetical protein [Candidatus Kaiserbacteria bacterium]
MHSYISPDDSFKIEKAITFLVENYKKTGKNPKPVVLHSLRVGMYLLERGYETDAIIIGVLHDLLEDSEVSLEDIKRDFSPEIATWVDSVSFKPDIADPVEQYQEMFNRTISAGRIPVIVKAADMLANSLYIHLVPDLGKQRMLLKKMSDFIKMAEGYSSEPVIKELEARCEKENARLTNLETKQ